MNTHEVMQQIDGRITYRQLDYWIRTKRITLAADPHGSGVHRTFEPVEVDALMNFVSIYEHHQVCARQIADGTVWADLIRLQRLKVPA